jgi:uncharacterized protein YegJ (DUF2314 family)
MRHANKTIASIRGLVAALLIAILPAACWPAPQDDGTVLIRTEDDEMNAAIAKAAATLDDFLKIAANPPAGASGFKLKVRFHDGQAVEHMWVMPFRQTGRGFVGVLANEPELVKNVANGQRVEFTRADVSDWGYVLNGRQKGSFTICVMFKHMPAEEVAPYRRDNGFDC